MWAPNLIQINTWECVITENHKICVWSRKTAIISFHLPLNVAV